MAKKVLTSEEKSVLKSMFLRSHMVFMNFNMVKMEANAFTMTMSPAIESIYGDDVEEKKAAYLRHQNFFNTHAVAFSFIAGLAYAMEKERKETGAVDGRTIENIKAALMGPTAGMFDSLFFNCLRVIAAGIGIGLCAEGNFLGTIIFILLYGVSQSVFKYLLVNLGYVYGTSFIDMVFSTGLMGALTKSASVLGLIMVGAMTAQMVNVPLNWTLNIGQTSVVVGDIFNQIFPGMLGVILLFTLVALIKKGKRPTQLILGILVFAIVGAFLGIF
ncbi:MAG: PTS system mannose/fructose/sorbose family transporter subunit IID [Traorella sp.]